MEKHEAEAKIVECIKQIDAVRQSVLYTDDQKKERIRQIDTEIKELKKITGQRHHKGTMHVGQ